MNAPPVAGAARTITSGNSDIATVAPRTPTRNTPTCPWACLNEHHGLYLKSGTLMNATWCSICRRIFTHRRFHPLERETTP